MTPRAHTLTVTIDLEQAAQDAYEQFVAHNTRPIPWADLSDLAQETWRRIASRTLSHVRVVEPQS